MTAKEEVKSEKRRLSVHVLDGSSESELTPSPSPKVQRRILKVSSVTSSSEDIKTESADSSVEDDEFIRKQIMGMGDEEDMSVSEDEKEKNLPNVQAIQDVDLDNTSVTVLPLSPNDDTNNEGSPAQNEVFPKVDTETHENVSETVSQATFKKAMPVVRQRQSTDEEVESITESLSKGSSSVQASSFTPGSSPTSASSLEEDSDSSPRRRKISGDKQHRKGKHRQSTQPLPTIEDSSEEEKMKVHGQPLSPAGDASSTEDLRQVTETRTSDSEHSVSIESEPDIRKAVQRGSKPSPTVIPYTPPDPFEEKDAVTKSLKSAEEAYEELIQKTKAIPGESPPDIEPLYGGMAIEDYLYESLVEEPEIKLSESQKEEPKNDTQSLKKLRSPEEVYEEMIQKKKELIMIEKEFQQAQTAMESSSSGSVVHELPSAVEACVVTIPPEDTNVTEQSDMPPQVMDTLSEFPVKKKKRQAPPRPSEPPKRLDVYVAPSTPSGSISFVRPMVPQDPALRKALFPIPDLKITQCSSGEEEDDSLADEYAIGISSDITPSDDSETKEDPSVILPLSETTEMEPICVVCEIPEPKPIPTPISAPELITTPSPVSPVSPPTSPATPDSSLASNATSASSFQAHTPLSSDSTPLSTPTLPVSFKEQSLPKVPVPLPDTIAAVPSSENEVPHHTSTPVIVTIPDVVSDPSKTEAAEVVPTDYFAALPPSPPQVEASGAVLVQMPDLVSSPSQVPINFPAALQVSAPIPAPVVISAQPTPHVTAPPMVVSTPASANDIPPAINVESCRGPVIVQMPDLVSTTASIAPETPQPISALITTPAQAQVKVVHAVPVQSSISSVSPVVFPTKAQIDQGPQSVPAPTTIVKKKVPPPPPPRSTSVSLPETTTEMPLAKKIDVKPIVGTTVIGQPMQSVVVDIQPRMDVVHADSAAVPQIVTPTRQGHVVIIVPSVENKSLLGQSAQDTATTRPMTLSHSGEITTHPVSDMPSTDMCPVSPKTSAVQAASALPIPPKPSVGTNVFHSGEVPIENSSTSPPIISAKPEVYAKPSAHSPVTSAIVTTVTATIAPVSFTMPALSQTPKPPPPIPPKPVSIPAGLVFSHKPGENVKPPPRPAAPKAATLPRMKEPPNALSLSLTRPVESKLGTTSPKSPVSPRHTKCLQTYVVITLPSEPGSPTEAITVQAPVRRGSIPSSKVSEVHMTQSEHRTPTEAVLTQSTVRRASVPTVKNPPLITVAPTVAAEQVITSEVLAAKVQVRTDSVPPAEQSPFHVGDMIPESSDQDTSIQVEIVPLPIKKPYVQQQQPMTKPQTPPKAMTEVITVSTEPKSLIHSLTGQAATKEQCMPPVLQQAGSVTEVERMPPTDLTEELVPNAQKPIAAVYPESLKEVLAVTLQPEVPLDEVVIQDASASVPSTIISPQVSSLIEIQQKEQDDVPTHVIITEAIEIRSPLPETTEGIATQESFTISEVQIHSKEQEWSTDINNVKTFSELPSSPQFNQPLETLPIVTEQHPNLTAEVMTLPTKTDFPVEYFTDSSIRMPEVAVVAPVPHPLTAANEVKPTPRVAELIPQPPFAEIVTTTPEVPPSPLIMEVQQNTTHPVVPPDTHFPRECETISSSVMSHSVPQLGVMPLQPAGETPTKIITKDTDFSKTISSEAQPRAITGMPIITREETTCRRRTSISSMVQPSYTSFDPFIYPEAEMPPHIVTTEAFSATRRESITMQQPLPFAQVVNMPAEKDVPMDSYAPQVPYTSEAHPSIEQQPQVLTYSSEYDHPLEIITTEAYSRRTSMPNAQDIPQGVSVAPVTITKIQQESIESQEIRGPEKVVSSMSHLYSSSISTSGQPPESLPSLVTKVVTTEVQRTTVSVVHERLPQAPPPSVEITIQPDIAKVQPLPKQNGKIIFPSDVIDLRTIKAGIKMTEQGMDLTPPESYRQTFSTDLNGRQITAVQPEIVNLSTDITPATTLSVVTDSITIVTCTATIASYNNTPAEKPLDLQGPVTSLPLPLTTYKPFEPLAQIVYRPVKAQPVVSPKTATDQDVPINLSFETLVSSERKQRMTSGPALMSNGHPVISLEATGAMDLSNYRPMRAIVALSGTSPGVVTTVVEDDGIPVDLTAGRRSVCCDVIYKLPFTGSCRTQPPVTTQPDHRDDHYNNVGLYGTDGMKAAVSETNLTEAGLSPYDLKNTYEYFSGSSDGAIDLTAAKLSAGEYGCYTTCFQFSLSFFFFMLMLCMCFMSFLMINYIDCNLL